MTKWTSRSKLRKRLVQWVDRNLANDPDFGMDSFICGWLNPLQFDDLRVAVRQCDEDDLYNLDNAKDEITICRIWER